ncbi:hypothetical protein F4809DRAFT_655378 [Biscogniauxia mediterranea]|nr:hypothetical protein F4809DRAFT_655378 [Biscogniauxia mediterranea]
MSGPFNLTTSWLAPGFLQLNLTNCSTLTPFFTDLALVVTENNTDSGPSTSEGFATVLRFLSAAVPENWPYPPDASQLALWYLDVWANKTYQFTPEWTAMWTELTMTALGTCNAELCNNLQIKGDPEVSGRGMMGAYYISEFRAEDPSHPGAKSPRARRRANKTQTHQGAILSTIYFFVLITDRLGPARRRPSRVLDAFRESTNTFLDAALVFAAAMLTSTAVRYASFARRSRDDDVDDYSTYRLLGSVFMSTFSIFPCLVLQCAADGLRRRFLRQGLWVAVVGLSVAVAAQTGAVYADRFFYEMSGPDVARLRSTPGLLREFLWFQVCDNRALIVRTTHLLSAGTVLLVLNFFWLVYYVLASLPSVGRNVASALGRLEAWRVRRDALAARWRRTRPYLRLLDGIACSVVMWLLLGFFTAWCHHVQSKAPSTDEDTEWTFGQVLSLATWVPVLVEWLGIIVAGPEKGLGERLSTRYEVTKVTVTDEKDWTKHAMSSEVGYGSLAPPDSVITKPIRRTTTL